MLPQLVACVQGRNVIMAGSTRHINILSPHLSKGSSSLAAASALPDLTTTDGRAAVSVPRTGSSGWGEGGATEEHQRVDQRQLHHPRARRAAAHHLTAHLQRGPQRSDA